MHKGKMSNVVFLNVICDYNRYNMGVVLMYYTFKKCNYPFLNYLRMSYIVENASINILSLIILHVGCI